MIDVTAVYLDAIRDLRDAYRRQMNCQIVHDSWHARGFTDSYLLRVDGQIAGYGSVGGAPREPKDTIKESNATVNWPRLEASCFTTIPRTATSTWRWPPRIDGEDSAPIWFRS